MSDFKKVSPLLDNLVVEKEVSGQPGRSCYAMRHAENGESYILKCLSVPASDSQVRALILSGAYADDAAVHEYYGRVVEDMKQELEIGKRLSDSGCFAGAMDYQIEPKAEGVGYDVYILHPLYVPLNDLLSHSAMTRLRAVNLGIDLCDAIIACREAGFLFQNIKPENIYLMPTGRFLLGGLGMVALKDLKYASTPEEYIGPYSAPELSDIAASPNLTVDLYSLGMVLYRIYNGNHGPFEDENTAEQMADKLRLTGRPLPTPLYADYELAAIITKACSFRMEDRFTSPEQLKQALMLYMQRNEVSDTLIVPPIVADPEPIALDDEPEAEDEPIRMTEVSELDETFRRSFAPDHTGAGTEDDMEEAEASAAASPVVVETQTVSEGPSAAREAPDAGEAPTVEKSLATEDTPVAEELPLVVESAEEAPVLDEAPVQTDVPKLSQSNLKMKRKKGQKQAASITAKEPEEAPQAAPEIPSDSDQMDIDELIAAVNEAVGDSQLPTSPILEECHEKEDTPLTMRVAPIEPAYDYQDAKQLPTDEEASGSDPKKKKSKWLTLAVLLLLIAAIGALAYYLITSYFVSVTELKLVDYSTTDLMVEVISPESQDVFVVTCTDNYGNSYPMSRNGNLYTFTGLREKTAYTITVSAADYHRLTSASSYTMTVTTPGSTEITEFVAKRGSQDGEVLLTFAHEGPSPTHWTLHITDDAGTQSGPFTVDSNSYLVTGLEDGTLYTFTLSATDDLYLTGTLSTQYELLPIVTVESLHVTEVHGNSVSLAWLPGENTPTEWTVACEADGYSRAETTTELNFTFNDLPDLERDYTFTVHAPGMDDPATLVLPANPIIVEDMQAVYNDDGTATVTWSTPAGIPSGGWHLSYNAAGSFHVPYVISADSEDMGTNCATLHGLIPNTQYEITLHLTADDATEQVFGQTSTTLMTPEASVFTDYEITPTPPYSNESASISFWKLPEKEDWTYKDLTNLRNSFASDEDIVVCVQVESIIASDDTVTLLYVIRDENGNAVMDESTTMSWDSLWFDRRHANAIPLPIREGESTSVSGVYTLEVYINGKLLLEKSFTIA